LLSSDSVNSGRCYVTSAKYTRDKRRTVFPMWSAPRPSLCIGAISIYHNKGAVFSASSVPRSYLEDNWHYSSVAGYSPDSNNVSTEAGESSLLRFVTRKRLVKADWKDLVWSDL
jgi:hypothetical protein